MPKYYVWLRYYVGPPVNKQVSSDELCYHDGHQHGVQPSQRQVDSLQESLESEVRDACEAAGADYPGDDVVQAGREVKTRSAK